jgi:hypothetical protein
MTTRAALVDKWILEAQKLPVGLRKVAVQGQNFPIPMKRPSSRYRKASWGPVRSPLRVGAPARVLALLQLCS